MSDRAVIETAGLRKEFGAKTAVSDLSLRVAAGEVFGFLGPNGAGKTTSLKMLLGLIEPTAGRGAVLGRPLGDRAVRARLGFLPEHFRFHDWLTGRELLELHGRLLGMPARSRSDRAMELLARVDLVDAGDRKLREYSKGMLQRVGLAQALLNRPELVFLDEPTSGLDPMGRMLVRDVIHELRAEGTTVFLNSHLLGEVEATCDRVVLVQRGRAVRERSLRDAAGSGLEVEIELRGATPETLAELARLGDGFEVRDGWARLEVAGEAALPEIARCVVASGAKLYRLQARRPSLEQWFLDAIGDDRRPG